MDMQIVTRVFALLCLSARLLAQAPVPAPAQTAPILIINALAHLGNGQVLPNCAIAFENGKITMVADARTIRYDRTKYAKIFDAAGKHVYPGFIACGSTLGLVEIDAARPTQDNNEVGAYNPNVRAIVAYNTDSEIPPTLRTNGILLAQSCPEGGVLSGTSAVVQLDAWNWEDALVKEDGIHLNWPVQRRYNPNGQGLMKSESYDKEVQAIQQFFLEAQAYLQQPNPATPNLKLAAMRPLFEGKMRLYIHSDQAKTIEEAVLFAEQFNLLPVIEGGSEVWKISDFIKSHKVPVLLPLSHRLPDTDDEDYDQPYKLARQLYDAGITFAFTGSGSWRQRNLPFQAGQAVGAGLPYEVAIQALTQNSARILGIDSSNGAIEFGKDATLFISEGDALDMRTCIITAAFIQGREISLDNKQKRLQKKFSKPKN